MRTKQQEAKHSGTGKAAQHHGASASRCSSKSMSEKNPVLCYVHGNFAYFTTQKLRHQSGDDWDDSPFEHNAGIPYSPHPNSPKDWNPDGTPKWEIIKVAWCGAFETPDAYYDNSPYSVERINAKAVPWLQSASWMDRDKGYVQIWAGTTLEEFKELIKQGSGEVYLKCA